MHIFLTGEKRIGKSSVLNRVLEITGARPAGFVTRWEGLNLVLSSPDEAEAACAAVRRNGGREVFTEVFAHLGVALVEKSYGAALTVMDELGFMESSAPEFMSAVLRRLEDGSPVLGVLRQMETDFLAAVAAHPNVELITATEQNRDALPGIIAEKLGI